MKIYSIHDAKAEYFLPPLFAKTDNQAKRQFIGSLGDSFQFRIDYTLFLIGEFDDDTGLITGEVSPALILSGASIPSDMDPNYQQHPNPIEKYTTPNQETQS